MFVPARSPLQRSSDRAWGSPRSNRGQSSLRSSRSSGQSLPRSSHTPRCSSGRHWGKAFTCRGCGIPSPPHAGRDPVHLPPVLGAMWSEDEEQAFISPPSLVSSVTSFPSSEKKRHPLHRRLSPQPDSGTSEQPAGVSDKDTFSVPPKVVLFILGRFYVREMKMSV